MEEVLEGLKKYLISQNLNRGIFAGNKNFWIKCDDYDVAIKTGEKYVIKADGLQYTVVYIA